MPASVARGILGAETENQGGRYLWAARDGALSISSPGFLCSIYPQGWFGKSDLSSCSLTSGKVGILEFLPVSSSSSLPSILLLSTPCALHFSSLSHSFPLSLSLCLLPPSPLITLSLSQPMYISPSQPCFRLSYVPITCLPALISISDGLLCLNSWLRVSP